MNHKEAADLLERYHLGKCTPEEISLIEDWFETLQPSDHLMTAAQKGKLSAKLKRAIDLRTGHGDDQGRIRLWPRLVAVAAAVAMIVCGVWFFNNDKILRDALDDKNGVVLNDVVPGKNGATLTLANGKVITLSDAKNGVVIGDAELAYSDGEILPDALNDKGARSVALTASTTKGQTYEFTLADGTKVWLNAASKLEIPSGFSGTETRRIKLDGEAYFEVASDKKRVFIVESGGQEVKVLGTHFNINAYKDEPNIRTTLLEGSVEIITGTSHTVIKPGQQATLKTNGINVDEVNVSSVIDWKNGSFRFKNEPLTSILRKVSRWYDVQIIYESDLAKMPTFSGAVSRFDNVSAVLQMLQETSDVKFTIDGKTIRVK